MVLAEAVIRYNGLTPFSHNLASVGYVKILMLETTLVFFMFVMTGFVVVRTGALSPAAIVCAFSTVSIVVFCYIVFGGGRDALQVSGLSFAIGDYHQEAPTVIGIYFLLTAVTAMATSGLSKKRGAEQEDTASYIQGLMDRFLSSSAMPLIVGSLFALTILAFLLTAVSGSNSPIAQVVYMGIGPGTVVYFSLVVYCWGKQSKLVIAMLLLLFLYNYAYCLAFYSRFAALTWVVATGLIASKRIVAGKSVFSVSTLLSSFLSAWIFLYAIQGRGDRSGNNANPFIWPLMIRHLFGITLDNTTLPNVATNIFQGPMVLAECLGNGSTVSYDARYMYLSFSPLPAFLDDWRSVIDKQHFVNDYTPFSSFAEVYYFGWPYIILFAVLLTVCIRILTKIYMQTGGAVGLLLTSPCVYSLLSMHQYPLRNSLRLIYFTTLFVYFLSSYLNKQAKKSGYARSGGGTGIRPAVRSAPLSPRPVSGRAYFKE